MSGLVERDWIEIGDGLGGEEWIEYGDLGVTSNNMEPKRQMPLQLSGSMVCGYCNFFHSCVCCLSLAFVFGTRTYTHSFSNFSHLS